jgi:hypothetical protein
MASATSFQAYWISSHSGVYPSACAVVLSLHSVHGLQPDRRNRLFKTFNTFMLPPPNFTFEGHGTTSTPKTLPAFPGCEFRASVTHLGSAARVTIYDFAVTLKRTICSQILLHPMVAVENYSALLLMSLRIFF